MLVTKLFEVRDKSTFIPVIATRMRSFNSADAETYLLARAGYGPDNKSGCVLLAKLEGGEAHYTHHDWGSGSRTIPAAHCWIAAQWDELKSGDVIDVEHILEETPKPKVSERLSGW